MDHFDYKDGVLHAEDVSVPTLAAEVGTPFYCYSTATLTRHYNVFADAFAGLDTLVCFSVKSNSNLAVIKTLGNLGAGADIVSEGELRRALTAGIPAERIVYSGVGKSRAEMRSALEAGIHQFNVESEPELAALNEVALSMRVKAPVALRINPDVDAGTHAKISTGKAENKFGIPWDEARRVYGLAAQAKGIEIVGVDVHIGSQITDLFPFEAAFKKVAEMVVTLRGDGHTIRNVDLGGGLGIPYARGNEPPPAPHEYAELIKKIASGLDVHLIFEPGRMITGNAGILVSSLIYCKQGQDRQFLICDAAMNDLIRPALYDAWHEIIAVAEPASDAAWSPADVVGPVCESGDTFASARSLPPLAAGDQIAMLSAGAYGAVQSGTYNSRPLIAEVLVDGDKWATVRPRQTLEDLIGLDRMPDWLEEG